MSAAASCTAARQATVCLGWDHGGLSGCGKRGDDPLIGIERFVSDQRVGLHRGQELVGTDQIMCFSAGQEEVDRVAERVGQGVYLGAQSTARPPNRLVAGFMGWPAPHHLTQAWVRNRGEDR
jgi:hypothetical protein